MLPSAINIPISSIDYLLERHGVNIRIRRGNSRIAAQKVIIVEATTTSVEEAGEVGRSGRLRWQVIGDENLDIRRGDSFSYRATPTGRDNFRVTSVDERARDIADITVASATQED